jgi:hypothetical protein
MKAVLVYPGPARANANTHNGARSPRLVSTQIELIGLERMGQGGAAHFSCSHKLFDYARKTGAESRGGASRHKHGALAESKTERDGVNQRMAKTVADLFTEEVRDEHN